MLTGSSSFMGAMAIVTGPVGAESNTIVYVYVEFSSIETCGNRLTSQGVRVMPRVSSSSMVIKVGVTVNCPSESVPTISVPSKMTVSSSSSTSSSRGFSLSLVVPLVSPAGITMSKNSTRRKSPSESATLNCCRSFGSAVLLTASICTRTSVSTVLGSGERKGASAASVGHRISENDAVTLMTCRSAASDRDSKGMSAWIRANSIISGSTTSSSSMVTSTVF